MNSMNTMPSTQTLNRTPERALRLVMALGKRPAIRQAMDAAGFSAAEAAEGMRLVMAVAEVVEGPAVASVVDRDAANAQRRLASEGVAFLKRTEAALARRSPVIAAELFAGLDATLAPGVPVHLVVDRLTALSADARPEAGDGLALPQWAGLGAAQRLALTDLVRLVTGQGAAPALNADAEGAKAARQANLLALYRWYQEWAETARAVAPRRQDLIALGLAHPRAHASRAEVPAAPTTAPNAEAV